MIIVYIHLINSLGPGGAQTHLVKLLDQLIVAGSDEQHVVVEMVHVQPALSLPPHVALIRGPRSRTLGFFSSFVRLWRASGGRSDVVFVAWMYHSCVVASIVSALRRPRSGLVFNIRHGHVPSGGRLGVIVRLLGFLRRRGTAVVYNSVFSMQQHERMHDGATETFVVPNGILLPAREDSLPLSVQRAGITVGFVGRNHPDKGADLLPAILAPVLAKRSEVIVQIGGAGTEELAPAFERAALVHGFDPKRVTFTGHVDPVDTFLRGLDVLIVPSRTESFPNIALEAMLRGVPVAFRRVGELPAIFGELLQGADTDDELRAETERLIELTADERSDLSDRLRERVAAMFDLRVTAQQHLGIWRNALAAARGGAK